MQVKFETLKTGFNLNTNKNIFKPFICFRCSKHSRAICKVASTYLSRVFKFLLYSCMLLLARTILSNSVDSWSTWSLTFAKNSFLLHDLLGFWLSRMIKKVIEANLMFFKSNRVFTLWDCSVLLGIWLKLSNLL